jgi:hypothetical protein
MAPHIDNRDVVLMNLIIVVVSESCKEKKVELIYRARLEKI